MAETVSFTAMKDGTREEYALLAQLEKPFLSRTADRVLDELRRPDEITEFGSARLMSDTTRIDVRVAEVCDPRPQEQILIGEETFLIQGEPRRDRERLIWTIELAPA